LLVACAPGAVQSVLDVFAQNGFDRARVIGAIVEGDARIVVKRSHRHVVEVGERA
jgi:selenide,water dikinase